MAKNGSTDVRPGLTTIDLTQKIPDASQIKVAKIVAPKIPTKKGKK